MDDKMNETPNTNISCRTRRTGNSKTRNDRLTPKIGRSISKTKNSSNVLTNTERTLEIVKISLGK
ncbi:MAG: hypothetical protein A7316_02745 [Candidatus Altiarchaeales archaeon WOR_SM1_86-2]|nr:MAG: hypothetical protein A7316_02745 [Candidatus Altiarchaeales archaeon WOR_SM1_86-2]